MWDYFELQSPTPIRSVMPDPQMPTARWFEGAEVNYTAQVFRFVESCDTAGAPAIIFANEKMLKQGEVERITWTELRDQSATLAATLRQLGVGKGDRVAAYLPNTPEAIIGLLACASLGATWSLCAPDMGVSTIADRFRQIEPRVLIACDGAVYGGKLVDRRETVTTLLQELPSLETLIVAPNLERSGAGDDFPFDTATWKGRSMGWVQALQNPDRQKPVNLPFDHPLWIVYSSGTTGLPKAIVHGHGGVLIEMLKLHHFHLNLSNSATGGERFHWYSSTGWVMWNLQVSALLLGTTVCIYDGHPAYPEGDALWRFADVSGASFVGAGAAYYAACEKSGLKPARSANVSGIRALGSTGSPLAPESYAWGEQQIGNDVWWAVISGGTDIASAFLGGTPELPTHPGEMQGICLGADIQAWDENGQPLIDEVGELVCVQPMPSMPLYFWGDKDNRRYHESYFDVYPGVWRHGDWLRITPDGTAIIYGRSDTTLNRHGHRLGTSELYHVVEQVPEVLDSLVVDVEYLGQASWMPLFVALRPGCVLDESLIAKLRECIRKELSPRFLPDEIIAVEEIPKTLTGKKQELPVKKLLVGKTLDEVVNKDACANPQAMDWFAQYAAKRRKHGSDSDAGSPQ